MPSDPAPVLVRPRYNNANARERVSTRFPVPITRLMSASPSSSPATELVQEVRFAAAAAQANLVVLQRHGTKLRTGLAEIRSILHHEADSPLTRRIAQVFSDFELEEAADTVGIIDNCTRALRAARRNLEALGGSEGSPHGSSRRRGRLRPATRRARVLVVDDERLICTAYQRMLSPYHDVVTVDNARKARALLERDTAFDIVICDLMMPDVDGATLYRQVLERHPNIAQRFVFCSGGPVTAGAQGFASSIANLFLEKPISLEELLEAVDHQLDGGRPVAPRTA
ncbi:MAG: response regulator [Myxococcales bacterium FL481]|nr:MAG: response regulator [Myxococcales bacterium FL481]